MKRCAVFTILAMASLAMASQPPNIVLILADDQGWNALSARMDQNDPGSGSTWYQTPNLDRLVSQGTCFSQAYSAGPTCSPSRNGIQYGRSPLSLNVASSGSLADARDEDSLAHAIKRANPIFVTAHLGKWHIKHSPDDLGYDVHDGPTGNGEGNSKDANDPKKIFSLSQRGNEFMEAQVKAGKPFFLQISHYANHLGYKARTETIGKYDGLSDGATPYQKDPLWAAMNENLDAGVGMVLDKLEELGIADNTYVIYTADNGYEDKHDSGCSIEERGFYKAFPLRSHKYTLNEGGIRVPFIVRGRGIPVGRSLKTPVIGCDIFPTVMHILGAGSQIPVGVEGGSLLPVLQSGEVKQVVRKNPFFAFRFSKAWAGINIALVQDGYKLLKSFDSEKMYLWNLADDQGEAKNLIGQQPERAEKMHKAMEAYLEEVSWDVPRKTNVDVKKTGKKKLGKKK